MSAMTTMPPPRQPEPVEAPPAHTTHSLSVLSEYTHTVDTIPLDLSRNFGDLRELDAVLSSSMSSLTSKITQLTSMIETKAASPEDRLWLLADIAEEVGRLKPGVDDKIRVACHTADTIRGHRTHMSTLLDAVPDDEFAKTADRICRHTRYPWVSEKLFGGSGHGREGGRGRNRRNLLANGDADDSVSPNKRRRTAAVDADGEVIHKSPRKERTGDAPRQRRKRERAASPAESLISNVSQMPPPSTTSTRQNNSNRGANGAPANKRSKAQAVASAATAEDNTGRADFLPPSANHPSLPEPFANTSRNGNGARTSSKDWPAGQLEGPGMPVARSLPDTPVQAADPETDNTAAPADGDQDGDDTASYCLCGRGSFGEMIACDGVGCTVEWYHLECVGLSKVPTGEWFCEDCRKKTTSKRGGRGGKRRAGGGRAAARNAAS